MQASIRTLWNEEHGAVVSAEIMLVGTLLVIGVIVGLKSVRDSVVTELADTAQAFSMANQSFFFGNAWGGNNGNHWGGSGGWNSVDSGSTSDTSNGWTGGNSTCLNVAAGAWSEN